jgi:hypothetical protein
MLGNIGNILQQVRDGHNHKHHPDRAHDHRLAVVGIMFSLGRISMMLMAGAIVGIVIIGLAGRRRTLSAGHTGDAPDCQESGASPVWTTTSALAGTRVPGAAYAVSPQPAERLPTRPA